MNIMNIYKTFDSSGKNELAISNMQKLDAVNFIDQYVLSFIKRVYGSNNAEQIFAANSMSEDEWFYKKDSLPLGHYFVTKTDSPGYVIYVIYETTEENTSMFSLSSTYQYKHIERIFCIFALNSEPVDITKSVLQIKNKIEEDGKYAQYKDPWSRISAQVADIANARTDYPFE